MTPRIIKLAVLLIAAMPLLTRADKPATRKSPATVPEAPTIPGQWDVPKYHFSLKTPTDWTRDTATEKSPVVLSVLKAKPEAGTAATMVQVQYRPITKGKNENIAKQMAQAIKDSDAKAEVSPTSYTKLGGVPASQIAVVAKIKGVQTRTLFVVSVKDKHLYVLCLINDAKDPPLPDTILTSFIFTG